MAPRPGLKISDGQPGSNSSVCIRKLQFTARKNFVSCFPLILINLSAVIYQPTHSHCHVSTELIFSQISNVVSHRLLINCYVSNFSLDQTVTKNDKPVLI